jgi:RNA polymerase sigma-32 factor
MATTNVPSNFFTEYCSRVSRGEALSPEVERKLATAWLKKRDKRAAEKLVQAHLPVVVRLARRFKGYGVPQDELIAEGNLGLLRALEKFDLRGVRFKTYATYWVRAYMLALAMRSASIVTVGTGAVGARFFFKLRSARAKAEARLGVGHEGINALLAQQFGVTEEVIRVHTARLGSSDSSLDAPLSEDGETTAMDLLPSGSDSPEEVTAAAQQRARVRNTVEALWRGLDARERALLTQRLLAGAEDEVTLEELGKTFGLSRERLRQIEKQLKARVAAALRSSLEGGQLVA